MKLLGLLLFASASFLRAETPPDDFLPGSEKPAANAPEGKSPSMVGMWYRQLPKHHRQSKWYGYGHVSVTEYDEQTRDVTGHMEATWTFDGTTSREKVAHTDAGYKKIKGKLIEQRVVFTDANTMKLIYSDGSSETWTRVQTPSH